jgi:hypothetical protein
MLGFPGISGLHSLRIDVDGSRTASTGRNFPEPNLPAMTDTTPANSSCWPTIFSEVQKVDPGAASIWISAINQYLYGSTAAMRQFNP